jgi:uncharacterized protein (DUF58 family)
MIHQQDPIGLITFDEKIRHSLPPRSKRTQLGNILAILSKLRPTGPTEIAKNLQGIAAMIKHRSLIMLFSDLLTDPEPTLKTLKQLRHRGHDVIVFHILDEAEVHFPFSGLIDFREPETGETLLVDADGMKADYLDAVRELCETYRRDCFSAGIDYVGLNTSMPFDKALVEYLSSRQARF